MVIWKSLHPSDSLERAVELTLAGAQRDFPVLSNGGIEGVLTQTALMKALSARGNQDSVASAVQKRFVSVDSLEMLEDALAKLKDCDCHTLPVTRDGKLVGLVTMDQIGEFVRIHSALKN